LFAKDAVLFPEEVDRGLLVAIDPPASAARKTCQG